MSKKLAVMKMNRWITGIICLTVLRNGFSAEFSAAPVFTDHMVLQRERPVPVWGTAQPGAEITVEFAGQKKCAVASERGKWQVEFDPMPASSESRVLKVSCNHQSEIINHQFSDVLIGEVWLCSGQSNMEWPLGKTDNAESAIASANLPVLRLFAVPRTFAADPQDTGGGVWQVSSSQTVHDVSAVAYYFGKTLQQDLDVPVGLIISAWGGSMIEPWIPGQAGAGLNRQDPSVLYNAMIHPYIPFAIRGVIWYQGESNRYDGMAYTDKARALIEGWRTLWGYDFPFYLVQIAPFQYKTEDPSILPAFWEAQTAIAKTIPKTGMVIINDCAALDNIHPPHKETVGVRLARLAEANEYGLDAASSGPVFRGLEKDGASLLIRFDSAGGLTTRDGLPPDWFELAGADGSFKKASARIQGSSVVLHCDEVPDPVAARFAWHKTAAPNLMNSEGWPAGAFRSGNMMRPPEGIVPIPEAAGFQILYQAELPEDPEKKKEVCTIDNRKDDLSPFSRTALCLEVEFKNSGIKQYLFVAADRFIDDPSGFSLQSLMIPVRLEGIVLRSNDENFVDRVSQGAGSVRLLHGSLGIEMDGVRFAEISSDYRIRKLTVLVK